MMIFSLKSDIERFHDSHGRQSLVWSDVEGRKEFTPRKHSNLVLLHPLTGAMEYGRSRGKKGQTGLASLDGCHSKSSGWYRGKIQSFIAFFSCYLFVFLTCDSKFKHGSGACHASCVIVIDREVMMKTL